MPSLSIPISHCTIPQNSRFLFDKDPASLGNSFPRKGRTNDSPNQHLGIERLKDPELSLRLAPILEAMFGWWLLLVVGCFWLSLFLSGAGSLPVYPPGNERSKHGTLGPTERCPLVGDMLVPWRKFTPLVFRDLDCNQYI